MYRKTIPGREASPVATTTVTVLMAKRGLYKKRKNAWSTLLIGAAGTGAGSAAPTPGLEAPKQAVIAVADLALMARIYDIYFDEDIGAEEVARMLMQEGLAITVTGGLAYGAVKVTEALLSEVLNWVPGVGWITSGTITASVTLTVGSLWLWRCDTAFRQKVIRGDQEASIRLTVL
jgi:hypothetical protein